LSIKELEKKLRERESMRGGNKQREQKKEREKVRYLKVESIGERK